MVEKLVFVCDKSRHLVCVPYTKENLHKMAEELNIKRCHFHKNHYDIPARRIDEIKRRCIVVESTKQIVEIIRSPQYAEIFILNEIKGGAAPPDFFLKTQIEYHGREEA